MSWQDDYREYDAQMGSLETNAGWDGLKLFVWLIGALLFFAVDAYIYIKIVEHVL